MRRACWIAIALTACLAPQLAADAPRPAADDGPPPIATRQNVFAIPFRVDNNGGGKQAAEVQLHLSVDGGASWQLASRVPPTAGRFKFTAPRDGQYWFMVRTLDQQGVLRPKGPPVAELKVIVDTTAPVLELKGQRGKAGELRAQWRIRDAFLRADSLKISYRATASSDAWQPVATDPLKTEPGTGFVVGEATWWPSMSDASVTVRAEVADLAGNATTSQARLDVLPAMVNAPPGAAPPPQILPLPPTEEVGPGPTAGMPPMRPLPSFADSQFASPQSAWPPQAGGAGPSTATKMRPQEPAVSWPAQKMAEPLVQAEAATPPPKMPTSFPNAAPPAEQLPVPQATGPAESAAGPVATKRTTRLSGRVVAPPEAILPPPAIDPNAPKPLAKLDPKQPAVPPLEPTSEPKFAQTPPPAADSQSKPNATKPQAIGPRATGPALGGEREAPPPLANTLPPGVRPRMVNTRRFELGYDVDSVGSDGISKVELWGTRDGGRTWQCFGADSDTRSPFPVRVDGEGLYGFRMIVETTSGLRGMTPRSGELPDIWVGVDTTKPAARLVTTEPRPALKTTEVFVRWEADDQMLAPRPVTLLFSPEASGPWTVLASGLENSGEYHWRIDARIPDRIFIRLEVRDEAGNVAAAESREPITIDRIRPQGRILDVRPIGEARQRPATLR